MVDTDINVSQARVSNEKKKKNAKEEEMSRSHVVFVDLGGMFVDVSNEGGLHDVDVAVEHRVVEADVR